MPIATSRSDHRSGAVKISFPLLPAAQVTLCARPEGSWHRLSALKLGCDIRPVLCQPLLGIRRVNNAVKCRPGGILQRFLPQPGSSVLDQPSAWLCSNEEHGAAPGLDPDERQKSCPYLSTPGSVRRNGEAESAPAFSGLALGPRD